jgi:hypothetical protein
VNVASVLVHFRCQFCKSSGDWLGVRQVTFAIFFSPVRLGVEERTVAWLLTFGGDK